MRQRQLKQDDHTAQQRNRRGVTESIEKPQLHACRRLLLHARDVGNCSDVVVVEPMAETQDDAGNQSDFQRSIQPAATVSLTRNIHLPHFPRHNISIAIGARPTKSRHPSLEPSMQGVEYKNTGTLARSSAARKIPENPAVR